jgi:predicted transcriptional regulator
MTKEQIKAVLDRVLTWPEDRQQDAAEMLLMLEAHEGELYHPSDEEWAAIQEGLEQARRGEFVPDEEMEEFWSRQREATKSPKEVLVAAELLPEEGQDQIAAERENRGDKLRELRAEIELGIRQLDAGEGRELDIEEFLREMHEKHRKGKPFEA